jgi:hypothetical protein
VEQCGLASTVRADESDDTSFWYSQSAIAKRPVVPVRHSEPEALDDIHDAPPSSPGATRRGRIKDW